MKLSVTVKQQIIPILKKYHVKKASLFGSYVRGGAKKRSDIDILIEPPKHMSLLDLVGVELELEDLLKKKVDLVTYNSLHPLLKDRILKEQRIIYEKR